MDRPLQKLHHSKEYLVDLLQATSIPGNVIFAFFTVFPVF